MKRQLTVLGFGLLASGMFALLGGARAADDKKSGHEHAAHFDACAKACADCMNECEKCGRHCAELLVAGQAVFGDGQPEQAARALKQAALAARPQSARP